jgi:hypothetical protein
MASAPPNQHSRSSTPEQSVTENASHSEQSRIFLDLDESQVKVVLVYHILINILIHLKKLLGDAEELKLEGNDYFRAKQWNQALVAYQSALGHLPKRPVPRTQKDKLRTVDEAEQSEQEQSSGPSSSQSAETEDVSPTAKELYPLQPECAKARSILNANIAACHVKLVRVCIVI